VYILVVELLIGLEVGTFGGFHEARNVAVLFLIGAATLFFERQFRAKPEILIVLLLFGLSIMVAYANELLSQWRPDLNTILVYALYVDLSPIGVICVALGYLAVHRRRQRAQTEGPDSSTGQIPTS
jgi:ABC-type arginine transport system permease subunit